MPSSEFSISAFRGLRGDSYLEEGEILHAWFEERRHEKAGKSWRFFLEENVGVPYASAERARSIYRHLILGLGLSSPDLRHVGVCAAFRLGQLAAQGVVTKDNAREWIKRAKRMGLKALEKLARNEIALEADRVTDPLGPSVAEPPRPSQALSVEFKALLTDDQATDLKKAMDLASVLEIDPGAQLQILALNYLAGYADASGRAEYGRWLLSRIATVFDLEIYAKARTDGAIIFRS